ncbi:MAG: hypothetical protein WCW77_00100 [Patescibacteria group bacterium]|jgi:hypothetical protein
MALKPTDLIKITPEFLSQYKGQKFAYGGDGEFQNRVYDVTDAGLVDTGQTYQGGSVVRFDPYSGIGQGSRQDTFKYFNLDNSEFQNMVKTNNPGQYQDLWGSAQPKFRARNSNEDMYAYLSEKQTWEKQNLGSSSIQLGLSPEQLAAENAKAPKPVFQTSGQPPVVDQAKAVQSMLYKNSAGATIDPSKYTNLQGPALDEWAKSQGYSPVGAQSGATGQNDALNTALKNKVDQTNSELSANENYVNAVFQAYHGRPANKEELTKFTGQKVGDVLKQIKAGSPDKGFNKELQESGNKVDAGLQAALDREAKGQATATDQANLAYARQKGMIPAKGANGDATGQIQALGNAINNAGAGGSPSGTPTVTPTTPEAQATTNEQVKALEAKIAELMGKTPEELELEKTLNNLYSSEEMGINKIKDQPIAMDFITGQAAAVERRVNTQANTLTRKLATEQARRAAALDVAKFELGREDVKTEKTEAKQEKLEDRAYQEKTKLDDRTYQDKEEDEDFAKDLALKGYFKISGPSGLKGLKEDQILRMPDGTIYKKPAGAEDTQIVTANSRTLLINSKTGEIIKDLGNAYKGTGSGSSSSLTKEEQAFKKVLDEEITKLARGGSWAQSWNRIKGLYPDVTNEQLDQMLNKGQYYSQTGKKEEETNLTRANVSKLYGLSDDDTKNGFLGNGKTNRQKLDDIMASITQYQAVGYSDDEILKLMKE